MNLKPRENDSEILWTMWHIYDSYKTEPRFNFEGDGLGNQFDRKFMTFAYWLEYEGGITEADRDGEAIEWEKQWDEAFDEFNMLNLRSGDILFPSSITLKSEKLDRWRYTKNEIKYIVASTPQEESK